MNTKISEKNWILNWKRVDTYKIHKGFPAGKSEEILPKTLLYYVSNRKVFKKYTKRLRFNSKLSFRWEDLTDFDTKDAFRVIVKRFCGLCKCVTLFSMQYSIILEIFFKILQHFMRKNLSYHEELGNRIMPL